MTDTYDIAVVGGGPAGAHAAFKAALLYRSCALFDKGRKFSRIFWSPRVDNLPGRFGESGRQIVSKGYDIIREYEEDQGRAWVTIHEDTDVTTVERGEDGTFLLTGRGKEGEVTAMARNLVIATGCVDRQPRLADFRRRDIEAILPYANKGLADYCLLCDGHTVKDKRVAVIGCTPGVRGIAISLKKNFGAETVLVPYCNRDQAGDQNPEASWQEVEERMGKRGIPILYGAIKSFGGIKDGRFTIHFEDGRDETFDKAWVSMGWFQVNNALAVALGADTDDDGFVRTTRDGRVLDVDGAEVPGLYAIGDITADSWKQIPVAWGEAETAVVDAFIHGERA